MAKLYQTDLSDAAWALVEPLLPAAKPGGRPRSTCLRAVLNAISDLLPTGCQWRLLPRDYPPWSTVHHHFRLWRRTGVWAQLHRAIHHAARSAAGRNPCPSVVIMDGQSVKTTERGGERGFDVHKKVKDRKRHILVDTLGLVVTNRVEPAGISDRRAGEALVTGLASLWPDITTIIAAVGHESREIARRLRRYAGWRLLIVKCKDRAFKITGLTWIVERTFAWLGRYRRLSKDYDCAPKHRRRCSMPPQSASCCAALPQHDLLAQALISKEAGSVGIDWDTIACAAICLCPLPVTRCHGPPPARPRGRAAQ